MSIAYVTVRISAKEKLDELLKLLGWHVCERFVQPKTGTYRLYCEMITEDEYTAALRAFNSAGLVYLAEFDAAGDYVGTISLRLDDETELSSATYDGDLVVRYDYKQRWLSNMDRSDAEQFATAYEELQGLFRKEIPF